MIPTPEFMATRWWERASEADKEAMRAIVARDAVLATTPAPQPSLPLIDISDLIGCVDRVRQ